MLYLLDRLIIWLSGKIHSVTLCRVDSKGARLSLYRDRSLVIPVESIAHKQELNLCNTCAIAKSTRTLAYNTQSRSDNYGKMWFLMFQNYYSAEVLKILMLFTDQVLSSIQCETDEFYFCVTIMVSWTQSVWELIIEIRVFVFIRMSDWQTHNGRKPTVK
jgi:hypothetical protein